MNVLQFFSEPYAQNILTCAGIVVTLVYVVLTYRMLVSSRNAGKDTAELAKSNRDLVTVMQGQLRLALEAHEETVAIQRRSREDAYFTVYVGIEELRVWTERLVDQPKQDTSAIMGFKTAAENGLHALDLADAYSFTGRTITASIRPAVKRLQPIVAKAMDEYHNVLALGPLDQFAIADAKIDILCGIEAMMRDIPIEGIPPNPQDTPSTVIQ